MQLHIDKVSKTYTRTGRKGGAVLDQFSAELTPGIHALLGPNGAGKTTLLRIVAGILSPTSGSVRLDGVDIRELDSRYRRLLGYVPQSFGYYRQFTVERFLQYLADLKCVDRAERGTVIDRVLAQTGLTARRMDRIRSLSGGMRQRLGIAQALLNEPRILILDEPTVGLDPAERRRFRDLLAELAAHRIVFLSTHIVSDVEDIADRIVLIDEGRCLSQGGPAELLALLTGRIWIVEGLVVPSEAGALHEPTRILATRREESRFLNRVYCEGQPADSARGVEPTLEDVYMLHFGGMSSDSDMG